VPSMAAKAHGAKKTTIAATSTRSLAVAARNEPQTF